MATRQGVREALASIFTTRAVFNAVYGYAPLDLQGFDKVLAIYTSRTRHEQLSKNIENNFYTLNLDVFVKRAGAETCEDTFDTLHEEIRDGIRDNQANANWDWLDLGDVSDAYFAEVSGTPYRVESHPLTVKVTGA